MKALLCAIGRKETLIVPAIQETSKAIWLLCSNGIDVLQNQTETSNTLRLRQNGRHFPDDIFKRIFLNEIVWILIDISLKFVPRDQINNIPTLVQLMARHQPGDKPLSEPMMARLQTHICVMRPQWVKTRYIFSSDLFTEFQLKTCNNIPGAWVSNVTSLALFSGNMWLSVVEWLILTVVNNTEAWDMVIPLVMRP